MDIDTFREYNIFLLDDLNGGDYNGIYRYIHDYS